jgi:hypothetical protein
VVGEKVNLFLTLKYFFMAKKKLSTGKKKGPGGNGSEQINWLEEWTPIEFEGLNDRGIENKKHHIELLVRGHLSERDEEDGKHHSIDFRWRKVGDDPVEYTVKAFLYPNAERSNDNAEGGDEEPGGGPGSGLTPKPPPQPPPPPI